MSNYSRSIWKSNLQNLLLNFISTCHRDIIFPLEESTFFPEGHWETLPNDKNFRNKVISPNCL